MIIKGENKGSCFCLINKRAQAKLQIILLILSIFSFSFLISSEFSQAGDGEEVGKESLKVSSEQIKDESRTNIATGETSKNPLFDKNGKEIKDTVDNTGDTANKKDLISNLPPWTKTWGKILGFTAFWWGVGYLAGNSLGQNAKQSKAIANAMGTASFSYQVYKYAIGKNWITGKWLASAWAPWAVGIGAGVLVLIATYKKTSTKTVVFTCNPWQAPSGGKNCELCNKGDLPCSEYRCKSLGQSCELLNKGQGNEKCAWVNPNDVNPPEISPNENDLTKGYVYNPKESISPPGPGFRIEQKSGKCIPPFTPIRFGVLTDEPAQCKIDFNHTEKFEQMTFWLGETNLYLNNHTQLFSLPGPSTYLNENITIKNDGEWIWFIRCKDKNGNENIAEYGVEFCVDPSPDTTPPKIEETSIENGACISETNNGVEVDFWLNEPAECKWDYNDMAVDDMSNEMDCETDFRKMNARGFYKCSANLTGVTKGDTKYYIRCKDQPNGAENDRVSNKESYNYILKSSTGLKMINLQPNGTIYSGISPVPIELSVETLFGCNEGKAYCYYSTTGKDEDYIQFYETNGTTHKQRQDLMAGTYNYWLKCVDFGGNVAINKTMFNVEIDKSAPVIARVYEEDDMLKIITVLDSECVYSTENCDFTFEQGVEMPYSNSTTHVSEWQEDKTYYIKCRDEFRNEPADCSITVQGKKNFLGL